MLKYLKYFETRNNVDREKSTIKKFQKNTNILSLDEAVDFAIENCQEYLNKPLEIYRGITERYDKDYKTLNSMKDINYFYGDPVRRFSRDNKNFYNLIIDNHKSWRGYPKRQKSFSCSLNDTYLGDTYYRVIPIDGSFWGICPQDDLFRSFRKGLEDCKLYQIDNFFDGLDQTFELKSDSNYYQLKKDLENPKDRWQERIYSEIIIDFLKLKLNDNKTVFDVVVDVMDPVTNEFHKLSYKDMCERDKYNILWSNSSTNSTLECWTESKCLFVEKSKYKNFMNAISNKMK